jgi:hypothetical protein
VHATVFSVHSARRHTPTTTMAAKTTCGTDGACHALRTAASTGFTYSSHSHV